MKKNKKALEAILLPQYSHSPQFMKRFLMAIHESEAEIERSPNNKKIKEVDESEISADGYDYFSSNKTSMEQEFLEDLSSKIGEQKASLFCDVIAVDWYDGRRLRNAERVRALKLSIRNYLSSLLGGHSEGSKVIQNTDPLNDVQPLLSEKEIAAVLTVNQHAFYRHIEGWKENHPNKDSLSSDDIFLRRGLALPKSLPETSLYKEWDFINSYSLAFSVPEQFSQMARGQIPAIINGDIELLRERILFFSPFIPGMALGQLEAGVIPSTKPLPLVSQGIQGGIHEYIIDPTPLQTP